MTDLDQMHFNPMAVHSMAVQDMQLQHLAFIVPSEQEFQRTSCDEHNRQADPVYHSTSLKQTLPLTQRKILYLSNHSSQVISLQEHGRPVPRLETSETRRRDCFFTKVVKDLLAVRPRDAEAVAAFLSEMRSGGEAERDAVGQSQRSQEEGMHAAE